jgi:hypothetical protein
MKQQIYLSIWALSIGLLTGCGAPEQSPTETVAPSPIEVPILISPTPVAITSPPPQILPSVPSPRPIKIPVKPILIATPQSIYPIPTPVAIRVPPAPVKTKAIQKEEPVSKLNIPLDPAQQITPEGIGVARIGMKFRDLKQQMGEGSEFIVKTSFMDGFDAIAVTKAGKVQYYIPYPTRTTFTDEDLIQHLMTDNPNYRTEQGVGPGTTIKQATSVYGSATLSLSKENESREFISFTQHPNGIAFRPKPLGSQSVAGDYPESNEEYLKTQKYDAKAAIGQITVSCADEQCGKESGN